MDFKLLNVQSYCQRCLDDGDDCALSYGSDALVIVEYTIGGSVWKCWHVKTDSEIEGVTPDLLYGNVPVRSMVGFTRSAFLGQVIWSTAEDGALVLVSKNGISFGTAPGLRMDDEMRTHIPHVLREALQAHDRMQAILKGLK